MVVKSQRQNYTRTVFITIAVGSFTTDRVFLYI